MHYKNSERFEEAVFGRCSGGQYLGYQSFSESMGDLDRHDSGSAYPSTRLGELLFFGVYEELRRMGMDPTDLRFQSARRSRLDIHHFTDGSFRLPLIPKHPVTVDLFNLDSQVCEVLKDHWDCLSEKDFQTYLFSYKMGAAKLSKESGKKVEHWDRLFGSFDFQSEMGRPENHLVLTPYYTENRLRRKLFSRLVAGYFAKVAKENCCQNMALLSP